VPDRFLVARRLEMIIEEFVADEHGTHPCRLLAKHLAPLRNSDLQMAVEIVDPAMHGIEDGGHGRTFDDGTPGQADTSSRGAQCGAWWRGRRGSDQPPADMAIYHE
jgi:hypothetical protein